MKRIAATLGAVLGLQAGLATAGPLPLEGRDINGKSVAANDSSAVFEYDPNLNITWLRDWNYASSSGYAQSNQGGTGDTQVNSNGRMGWVAAQTWASSLSFLGHTGWRLPKIVDTGSYGCDFAYSGTDCGYNVQTKSGATVYSEMAYLWYDELGNKAVRDTAGNFQVGGGLRNPGPFLNFPSDYVWSSTSVDIPFYAAFQFSPNFGSQLLVSKIDAIFAVAVLDGDIASFNVPAPGTITLLGLGLVGIGAARRKQA
jgi:hypothetical protein